MRRAAACSLLAVYVALAAGAVGLVVLQDAHPDAIGALGFAAFAGVGTLIALRRPDNAVGWLLLGTAIFFAAGEAGEVYAANPANPARVWVAWLSTFTTSLWFSLALIFLPLLFPDGHLPSPRWRPVLWIGIASVVLGAVASATAPGELELRQSSGLENPVRVEGSLSDVASMASVLLGAVAVVLAAAAVVVRLRRARGRERQQLKWFAYVGVLAAFCLSVAVIGSTLGAESSEGFTAVAVVGWLTGLALVGFGLPIATGIAILRHRLYDIDVVIRRTLVYGALTATLGATYLALVLLAGLALGESNVAIAVSTLAVAALFRPALRRIQALVDRRFYRRRYDATLTLEAFGARLRDELDLEALGADLRAVVADTVQPAHVSLWLRSER
jgi:hypothetical protein